MCIRSLLSAAVVGVAAAGVALAAPEARAAEPRGITVLGSAELRVAPDVAVAVLAVTTRSRTAEKAASENARRSRDVLEVVRGLLGPQDRAETLSYRIQPVYEYPKGGTRQQVGFEVVNALRVRTRRLEKVGAIFDRATAAADVSVSSLSFELENPGKSEAEALEAAGRDAKLRAERIAEGVGVTLRRVRVARERGAVMPPPGPRPMLAEARAAAVPTEIAPQELVVRGEVEVTYDIQ